MRSSLYGNAHGPRVNPSRMKRPLGLATQASEQAADHSLKGFECRKSSRRGLSRGPSVSERAMGSRLGDGSALYVLARVAAIHVPKEGIGPVPLPKHCQFAHSFEVPTDPLALLSSAPVLVPFPLLDPSRGTQDEPGVHGCTTMATATVDSADSADCANSADSADSADCASVGPSGPALPTDASTAKVSSGGVTSSAAIVAGSPTVPVPSFAPTEPDTAAVRDTVTDAMASQMSRANPTPARVVPDQSSEAVGRPHVVSPAQVVVSASAEPPQTQMSATPASRPSGSACFNKKDPLLRAYALLHDPERGLGVLSGWLSSADAGVLATNECVLVCAHIVETCGRCQRYSRFRGCLVAALKVITKSLKVAGSGSAARSGVHIFISPSAKRSVQQLVELFLKLLAVLDISSLCGQCNPSRRGIAVGMGDLVDTLGQGQPECGGMCDTQVACCCLQVLGHLLNALNLPVAKALWTITVPVGTRREPLFFECVRKLCGTVRDGRGSAVVLSSCLGVAAKLLACGTARDATLNPMFGELEWSTAGSALVNLMLHPGLERTKDVSLFLCHVATHSPWAVESMVRADLFHYMDMYLLPGQRCAVAAALTAMDARFLSVETVQGCIRIVNATVTTLPSGWYDFAGLVARTVLNIVRLSAQDKLKREVVRMKRIITLNALQRFLDHWRVQLHPPQASLQDVNKVLEAISALLYDDNRASFTYVLTSVAQVALRGDVVTCAMACRVLRFLAVAEAKRGSGRNSVLDQANLFVEPFLTRLSTLPYARVDVYPHLEVVLEFIETVCKTAQRDRVLFSADHEAMSMLLRLVRECPEAPGALRARAASLISVFCGNP